jgi:hypothetical protein
MRKVTKGSWVLAAAITAVSMTARADGPGTGGTGEAPKRPLIQLANGNEAPKRPLIQLANGNEAPKRPLLQLANGNEAPKRPLIQLADGPGTGGTGEAPKRPLMV